MEWNSHYLNQQNTNKQSQKKLEVQTICLILRHNENMAITKIYNLFISFFSQGHERTIRAKRNIIVSFFSKGISLIISFLIVPLTLQYVGKVEYGIWMTLSSIIHWFAFMDIGLGNGLRNKLAEAIAMNDRKTARIYVSSTYALIAIIAFFMLVVFYIVARYISWNNVFNTDIIPNAELLKIVLSVFLVFCVGFVINLLSSILRSLQKYGWTDIINIIAQLTGLTGIFLLVQTTDGSLFNLCLVYAGKSPLIMLIASILFFSGSLSYLRPRIAYMKIRKALPLINLGVKFFIVQMFYLIFTHSSVILVAQFFGPAEVTIYNLAVRYMTLGTMMYTMVLTPFLSAFTEAYTKEEYKWIRITINRINKIWMIASCVTILLVMFYRVFFKLWVGDEIQIPLDLIITLAIAGITHTYYNKYSLFLNGIGKIQLQIYLVGLQATLFIPLSYLFFRLNFGLSSLVVSQIIVYTIMAIFMHIQYQKIINKTATGIWSR